MLSTSNVLPQQAHGAIDEIARASALGRLPQELYDIIVEYTSAGLVSRAEAEEDREKLMRERSRFVAKHGEFVFEVEFDMCEH